MARIVRRQPVRADHVAALSTCQLVQDAALHQAAFDGDHLLDRFNVPANACRAPSSCKIVCAT